jgi:hypothetical protein
MLPKATVFFVVVAVLAGVVWMGSGCGDNGNGPQPQYDCDRAAELVATANDSLGRQMYRVINETMENADSSFRPRDIDFSGVNSLYEEAVGLCPSDHDAQFGSAFTGMMLFMTDEDFNDLIDRVKYVIDTTSFSPKRLLKMLPQVKMGGSLVPGGIPLHSQSFGSILPSLVDLDYAIISAAPDDPVFSDLQAILENSLLPKMTVAGNRLLSILADPDFTFTITPMMQGNPGASPIVIDRSDFRVFLAVLYASEAFIHIACARNLDMSSYSDAGIQEALAQNSSFLSLRAGGVGAQHMASAKTCLLLAEQAVEDAIDDLLAEINTDQTNDLIKVYPDDADDLLRAKDSLSFYATYLTGPKNLQIIWTTGWQYIEIDGHLYYVPIKDTFNLYVDLRKFFDNPMNNPKAFLPAYTLLFEHLDEMYKDYADEHFSRDRYWMTLDTIFGLTYPNDTPFFSNHLPDEDNDEFYRLLAEDGYWPNLNQQFVFGWDDVYYSCDPPGLPDTWCFSSDNKWNYRNFYYGPQQYRFCYEWQANSFAQWTWPDATFNGLLPGLTSDQIKMLLMGDGSGWVKSGCDTTGFFDDIGPVLPL